jgi:putative ABC transport system permease protein
MSDRVPAAVRFILAIAARLVPAYRRPGWLRQWVAELEHRCTTARGRGDLVRFALGSITHALYVRREEMRIGGLMADLRQSARALLRRPGFSALTVATLAIGIGAATAIFSLAEALLLRPLPLEYNDRLVRIFSTNPQRRFGRFSVSYPDYADFTGRADLFEAASFYIEQARDVSGAADPERIVSVAVHDGFFQTLGSPTHLGRVFTSQDYDPRNGPTAVLSESFWVGRFGTDSTVVGRQIRLDGVPHTVVGIVRDGLGWPARAQVWTPLQWGGVVPEYADARTNHTWQVIARLRPGVEVEDAHGQIREMARSIYTGPAVDARDEGTEAVIVPLHSSAGGEGAGALFATLGAAVFFVLLIACMNASGLLLTRAWARARELSLRSALGAGRIRLMLIVLGEGAVLALLGGVVGVVVGTSALERAFAMAPPDITSAGDVRLNASVLLGGVGISAIAALLASAVPALRASRTSVSEALKEGSGQMTRGRGGGRLRKGLVVAELALSLALLTGAALTVSGFQRQLATDPGFDAANLLSFTVRLPRARYGEPALVDAYYAQAVERLERYPGVLAASSTSRLPLGAGGYSLGRSFVFDGAAPPPDGTEFAASWVEVDPGYFETLGVESLEGRVFRADDTADSELVAIVNQRMARQMSPNESIVGRRIRSFYDENLPRMVVGVIPDLQLNGVSRAERSPLVLVPRAQSVRTSMAFLVRTAGDPVEMIPLVRRTMTELDADVALDQLQSLRDAHAADLAGIRFLTTLFGAFGLLALVLVVSGVYGLVSTSVSQRTREIGVRVALGATSGSVVRAVIRETGSLAAFGLTLGLVLAYVAGRVLAVGMNGIAVLDLGTYVGVAILLALSVLAASWFPATRATRVNPVEALRTE